MRRAVFGAVLSIVLGVAFGVAFGFVVNATPPPDVEVRVFHMPAEGYTGTCSVTTQDGSVRSVTIGRTDGAETIRTFAAPVIVACTAQRTTAQPGMLLLMVGDVDSSTAAPYGTVLAVHRHTRP